MSISNNTTKLQSLIDKINSLPEAGSGGENLDEEISAQETLISEQDTKIAELIEKVKNKASVTYPTLSNPASAENLQEGYQLIDDNGNIVTGTHVCPSGGGNVSEVGTCTVSFVNSEFGGDCYIFSIIATIVEDGVQKSYFYEGNEDLDFVVHNVVCGSAITLVANLSYTTPAYAEISGTATFDFSQEIGSYNDWIMGFTAPLVANENCIIYYSYEA